MDNCSYGLRVGMVADSSYIFMSGAVLSPHIVVVEDDRDILEALELLLSQRGYGVSVVRKAEDLAACLKKRAPDLLLLDIWVGGNDGRELARQFRADGRMKDVPIIILSANLSTPQIAEEVKADGFVLKPFDVDHLIGMVERLLKKKGVALPEK